MAKRQISAGSAAAFKAWKTIRRKQAARRAAARKGAATRAAKRAAARA